jgi:hypothetical protein
MRKNTVYCIKNTVFDKIVPNFRDLYGSLATKFLSCLPHL